MMRKNKDKETKTQPDKRNLMKLFLLFALPFMALQSFAQEIIMWNETTNKSGITNFKGDTIVPCIYDNAHFVIKQQLVLVELDKKYGLIDVSGKNVVPLGLYNRIGDFEQGIAIVWQGKKNGCIDSTGKLIVPCQYDYIELYYNESIRVDLNQQSGLLDLTGKVLVPIGKYTNITPPWGEKTFCVSAQGKVGFINTQGKEIVPLGKYDAVSPFQNGFSRVEKEGNMGYINKDGEEILPCHYIISKEEFQNGYAVAGMHYGDKDGFGLVDTMGNEVIPCVYSAVSQLYNGLALVEDNLKCGFFDATGKEVISFGKYSTALPFSEGLAAVRSQGRMGYINPSDEVVIPFKYDRCYPFSDGYAIVRNKGKYGMINKAGEEVIPCLYDKLSPFKHGVAQAKLDDKRFHIDTTGHSWENKEEDIEYKGVHL